MFREHEAGTCFGHTPGDMFRDMKRVHVLDTHQGTCFGDMKRVHQKCFEQTPGDMFRGHEAGACFGHTPGDMFRGNEAGTSLQPPFSSCEILFCQKFCCMKFGL